MLARYCTGVIFVTPLHPCKGSPLPMKKHPIHIATIIGSPNAILHRMGETVFEAAHRQLAQGSAVVLDFTGLRNASTAFFHAAIGSLYEHFPLVFDKRVSVAGLTQLDWQEKYADALDLARNPRRVDDIRQAMEELLEY